MNENRVEFGGFLALCPKAVNPKRQKAPENCAKSAGPGRADFAGF
jgi:hypothetical protein